MLDADNGGVHALVYAVFRPRCHTHTQSNVLTLLSPSVSCTNSSCSRYSMASGHGASFVSVAVAVGACGSATKARQKGVFIARHCSTLFT